MTRLCAQTDRQTLDTPDPTRTDPTQQTVEKTGGGTCTLNSAEPHLFICLHCSRPRPENGTPSCFICSVHQFADGDERGTCGSHDKCGKYSAEVRPDETHTHARTHARMHARTHTHTHHTHTTHTQKKTAKVELSFLKIDVVPRIVTETTDIGNHWRRGCIMKCIA